MGAPEPVEVAVEADGALRVSWDDGHESRYSLRYLRGYCPCAHCQGHGAGHAFVENDGPRIVAIEEVGNYALNLRYAGGHDTGIYSFELLRDLCPCGSCVRALGADHATTRVPAQRT